MALGAPIYGTKNRGYDSAASHILYLRIRQVPLRCAGYVLFHLINDADTATTAVQKSRTVRQNAIIGVLPASSMYRIPADVNTPNTTEDQSVHMKNASVRFVSGQSKTRSIRENIAFINVAHFWAFSKFLACVMRQVKTKSLSPPQ